MGGKDGRGEKPSASVGSQVSQRFIVYQSHYIMIIIIKIRVVNHGYATIKEIYVQRKQCHANKTNVHQRNMPPLIRTAFCSRIDSSWGPNDNFCVFLRYKKKYMYSKSKVTLIKRMYIREICRCSSEPPSVRVSILLGC